MLFIFLFKKVKKKRKRKRHCLCSRERAQTKKQVPSELSSVLSLTGNQDSQWLDLSFLKGCARTTGQFTKVLGDDVPHKLNGQLKWIQSNSG
jgi:hypothetical protein